jgi:hypothetical protein
MMAVYGGIDLHANNSVLALIDYIYVLIYVPSRRCQAPRQRQGSHS